MKAIAIIDIPDGGTGKWYIDGEIRYTEDESLMKKFDAEMIPLKPMPEKKEPSIQLSVRHNDEPMETLGFRCTEYENGWNDCIDAIISDTDGTKGEK